jgi:hypothetical protein
MTIFMKKNVIFIFLKIPIKRRTKKKKTLLLQTFFLKKNNKAKVWQKNWLFILPLKRSKDMAIMLIQAIT